MSTVDPLVDQGQQHPFGHGSLFAFGRSRPCGRGGRVDKKALEDLGLEHIWLAPPTKALSTLQQSGAQRFILGSQFVCRICGRNPVFFCLQRLWAQYERVVIEEVRRPAGWISLS